ncbi:MAG: hypothetical protein PXY39_07490 [archaeon]|nr:hypothetical protein [archaeon]
MPEEDKDMEQKREEVVHFLGEAFLGFLGAMAQEAETTPAVVDVPESPIPEGKTPEQFMEKAFELGKAQLTKRGRVNPAIFAFRKGQIRTYFIRNCHDGAFIAEVLKQVVRNETPESYGLIFETWMSAIPHGIDPKDIVPPTLDPNAKEALVGLYRGKEQFQLLQTFHRDEHDNKIIFEGEVQKLAGEVRAGRTETEGINVPIHDPTRDYIQ